MMSQNNTTINDRVITYLADSRLHRVFYLPPNPAKGRNKRLRVTYSDIGRPPCENEEDEAQQATIWFCGGFMAGRYLSVFFQADSILKARGVRFITIDRPGNGGTEAVPLEARIDTYTEIVPALLAHLKIRHVSLAAHSFGAVYALNLLLSCRDLLHPQHPTVDIFAPWVHHSHSHKTTIGLTDYLPRSGIASLHNLVSFVNTRVVPIIDFSGGMVDKVMIKGDEPPIIPEDECAEGEDRIPLTEDDRQLAKGISAELGKYIAAESIAGVSDEALLILKRTPYPDPWGLWGDVDNFVPILAKQEAARSSNDSTREIKIRAYHASNDALVGEKGPKWFDSCWTTEACGNVIDYEGYVWPKTTHDGILNRENGLPDKWIAEVAEAYKKA